MTRTSFWGFIVLPCILILSFFFVIPHQVDRIQNASHLKTFQQVPLLHQNLRIVDLHADTLLWDRDLLVRGSRGHVDLPRLREGNVGLQVFSVVTKTPMEMSYASNGGNTDNITVLAIAQQWPRETWTSLLKRALFQAKRLNDSIQASNGKLRWIRSQRELAAFLEARVQDPQIVGALLALEGSHALEGNIDHLQTLSESGFRMLSPAHMFDSEVSGSQQGKLKKGLTPMGLKWVHRMNAHHLIIDLAHASSATIMDVLRLSTEPVLVSHTGVEAICKNNRNLTDDQIRLIARRGGLIGVGFWDGATCGTDLRSIAKTLRHVINIGGLQSVALGSDWDGFVTAMVDSAHLGQLTGELLDLKFSETEIRALMGENALRFFQKNLPP